MLAAQAVRRGGGGRLIRRVATGVVLAALLVGFAAMASRVYNVHHQYGVWSWSPGAATPTLPFGARRYLRGPVESATDVPAGFVRIGTAPGHGEILGPMPDGMTPTILLIRYPDQKIIGYALSGGP